MNKSKRDKRDKLIGFNSGSYKEQAVLEGIVLWQGWPVRAVWGDQSMVRLTKGKPGVCLTTHDDKLLAFGFHEIVAYFQKSYPWRLREEQG